MPTASPSPAPGPAPASIIPPTAPSTGDLAEEEVNSLLLKAEARAFVLDVGQFAELERRMVNAEMLTVFAPTTSAGPVRRLAQSSGVDAEEEELALHLVPRKLNYT